MQKDGGSNDIGWKFEEKVSPGSHLHQGDLIAFQSEDRLRRFGLVVTADCDLTQRKHARLVTLVPVVELIDIIECYLLPELCERNREQIIAFVRKTLGVSMDLANPEDVEEVRARMQETTSDPLATSAYLAARIILYEIERLRVDQFKDIMKQAGLKLGNLDQRLEQQVRSKGDILILPSLESLSIPVYIAWVRHIWQVQLKDIVFRTSQVRSSNGQRVARLDSPYRYRLTQLMAQVFSDIGVPDQPRELAADIKKVLM